jgi:hypothetical protein
VKTLWTPVVKSKTLSTLETPSTLRLDKLPDPLIGLADLVGLEALEDQKNQQYPPLISSLYNLWKN